MFLFNFHFLSNSGNLPKPVNGLVHFCTCVEIKKWLRAGRISNSITKIILRRHYGQFLNSKLCHLVIMAGNFQDVFVSDIYDRNFGGFDPVYLENVVLITRRKSLFFPNDDAFWINICVVYVNDIYHIRVSVLILDKTPFLQPVLSLSMMIGIHVHCLSSPTDSHEEDYQLPVEHVPVLWTRK